MVWIMFGLLIALCGGGLLVDLALAPVGTTGSFKTVLPQALERARRWSPSAHLVGFGGRDLVDGRNGSTGGWEFLFRDASGRTCRVTAADHMLVLREIAVTTGYASIDPAALEDTPDVARRAIVYGLRRHTPASFSYEVGPLADPASSGPIYRLETGGRLAGTWQIDARSGELLNYQAGAGMNRVP